MYDITYYNILDNIYIYIVMYYTHDTPATYPHSFFSDSAMPCLRPSPLLITKDAVMAMKPGSVIVDLVPWPTVRKIWF